VAQPKATTLPTEVLLELKTLVLAHSFLSSWLKRVKIHIEKVLNRENEMATADEMLEDVPLQIMTVLGPIVPSTMLDDLNGCWLASEHLFFDPCVSLTPLNSMEHRL